MKFLARAVTAAHTEGTYATYSTGEKLFSDFCIVDNIPLLGRFPPSTNTLLNFCAWAATERNKTAGAIRSALSALRNFTGAIGKKTTAFDSPLLESVKNGCRKIIPSKKRPLRLPITVWLLARLLPLVRDQPLDARTMFAAAVVGVFGLLRSSEFLNKPPYGCTLLRRNVEFRPDRVVLHLTRSKTDKGTTGVHVTLFRNHGPLCPGMWASWALSTAEDTRPSAPLFQDSEGNAIDYNSFHAFLKSLCASYGLETGNISSHSLRIGGATTLIELGVHISTVKAIGRWTSDCYILYIRISEDSLRLAASALGKAAEERHAPVFCGMDLQQFSALSTSQINRFKRHRSGK